MKTINTVGIIGYGAFGTFIHKLVSEHFLTTSVKIYSRKKNIDSLEETCKSDVLFIAVDIGSFESILDEIIPLIGKDTIIVDVATVKKHTVNILKKHDIPYIATHPMFGPYSYKHKKEDLNIAICDHNLNHDTYCEIKKFLENNDLKVKEMSANEHDILIAETLFLTHFIGQVVTRERFKRTSVDTISFGLLMDVVESIQKDTKLFKDVFKYNPYCKDVVVQFRKGAKSVEDFLIE